MDEYERREYEREIDNLTDELDKCNSVISELRAKKGDLEYRNYELEKEIENLKNELERCKDDLDYYRHHCVSMR